MKHKVLQESKVRVANVSDIGIGVCSRDGNFNFMVGTDGESNEHQH